MTEMFKRTITAHDGIDLVGVVSGRPIFRIDSPDGSVVVEPKTGGTTVDFRHVARLPTED